MLLLLVLSAAGLLLGCALKCRLLYPGEGSSSSLDDDDNNNNITVTTTTTTISKHYLPGMEEDHLVMLQRVH